MKNIYTHFQTSVILSFILVIIVSCQPKSHATFNERVTLALREVGHQLLLNQHDSTSVVLPVQALANDKFQLQFESNLSIQPDSLVDIIKQSFLKADLPNFYITEVLKCQTQNVAYSYEMNKDLEKGIIPCLGRDLKTDCYTITVRFTRLPNSKGQYTILYYSLLCCFVLILAFLVYKKKPKAKLLENKNYTTLGEFKFYPEQHKLIKEAKEISLSNKECELLALFIASPNQIIKREELTKKVWEDNGVFVGRSLDTYISKLRQKLKDDTSIKLTNVHGVGYKLEIER
jgi:DNA-binding winged helix-turn-helix (wHTH) protein